MSILVADERAVSPVVGAALLIAISVLLATAIGLVVLDLDVGAAEEPSLTLSFEVDGNEVEMTHEGGDPLPAAEVVVLDQDGDELAGLNSDLTAGESEVIVTDISGENVERVVVVWQDPGSDTQTILATFEV